MTGVIGLSLSPVLNPSACSPSLKNRVLSHSRSMSCGSSISTSSAARQVAATDGGCDVENRNGRAAMMQEVDQVAAAGDVAAERADGLRQRADLHVDAAVQAEVIDGAASVRAEHAARVRIVHHHDAAVLLGEVAELRQRAEVAVHAEHAVGDEQLARRCGQVADDGARGVHVAVRKHLDRRAAQPRSRR